MEFLMKMSPRYQHIRSNILMIKELLSAAEAYRILMQVQTHQELSKGTPSEEHETPIACRADNKRKYGDKGKFVKKKGSYYCDHCKVYVHSMERCWKIHGYPANYRPNIWKKDANIKVNATQTNFQHEERHVEPKLTKEQDNKLLCLLKTQQDHNHDKEPSMAAFNFLKVSYL